MFGLSRQSYYKNKTSRIKRNADLTIVRDMVMRIRCKMPRIGTRKLYYLIKDELNVLHIKIGRDVLFNFLRAEHNGFYYDFNCHQSKTQNQYADKEFEEFKKTIKLI